MMKKIIIANWKMNPDSSSKAVSLFNQVSSGVKRLKKVNIVIVPPFVFIPFCKKATGFYLGAQNVFWKREGAYTGEISPPMLKSLNVRYVIVGHSERREHAGETDEMINKKVKMALQAGFRVVLCVGEKDRDDENFQYFVRDELREDLKGVAKAWTKNLIIAYEPIWAIGTGKAVRPEDLFEMATYIRRTLLDVLGKRAAYNTPVLYGGSVNAKNSAKFLNVEGVNGLLIGGASLRAKEFISIIRDLEQ